MVSAVVSWLDTVVDWVDTVVSWLDTVVVDGMPRMVDRLEAVGDLALVTVTLHGGMLVPVGLHMVVMVGQRGDDSGGHHEARRELSHDGAGAWLVAVLGWSLERGRFSTDGSWVRSSIYTNNTVRCQKLYYELSQWTMLLGGVLSRQHHNSQQPHHRTNTLLWSAVDRVLVTKLYIMYVSKYQQ